MSLVMTWQVTQFSRSYATIMTCQGMSDRCCCPPIPLGYMQGDCLSSFPHNKLIRILLHGQRQDAFSYQRTFCCAAAAQHTSPGQKHHTAPSTQHTAPSTHLQVSCTLPERPRLRPRTARGQLRMGRAHLGPAPALAPAPAQLPPFRLQASGRTSIIRTILFYHTV